MAIIHDLINVGHCAQNGMQGTSNDFCILDVARLKKYLRFPYGYKFADNFEPTAENFNLLIQAGTMTPLYTLVDSAFTTEANGIQTFGGGKKKLIEKMPYQIDAKMINGVQGYQNTLTVANAPAHSFLLVDENDNIFGAKGKDGKFRPISSEFLNVEAYMGAGSESANYMVQIQLDRAQFDTGLSALRSEDYDFEIDDIKGFTNPEISIPIAPVTGATTVGFKVLRKEDRVQQLGLTDNEVKVYVDGVDGGASLLSLGNGNYSATDLTALSLGDVVEIKTNDGTYDVVEVTATGTLLKSNTAQTIVVAP